MPARARRSILKPMSANASEGFRSGDALFTFDPELRILSWNRAAEELTGIAAAEAVGRRCWEILGGHDEMGALVCHAGCSYARLARDGWPVPGHELTIRADDGRRKISLSTIALRGAQEPVFIHLMLPVAGAPPAEPEARASVEDERAPDLTPRQREVLRLLAEGRPAKVIARELGLAETTVRNHIRAVLLELGCHSQLAAVAKGRRLGII